VRHEEGTTQGLAQPADGKHERHWADLVAKYSGGAGAKADISYYMDINKIRAKSVIWGCPEYQKTSDFNPASPNDNINTGYGMNLVANPADYRGSAALTRYQAMAWIRLNPGGGTPAVVGSYFHTNVWGRKAADHILVADSPYYFIAPAFALATQNVNDPSSSFFANMKFFGYSDTANPPTSGSIADPVVPVLALPTDTWIDGGRHLKPGQKQRTLLGQKGLNALFCDGHAATVSVREAWNGMMGSGQK
jgi:prepilin-type processing-associated H-X9-DG protein